MVFGKLINKYYRKYWYLLVLGILALLLVDSAQLYLPEILGDLVDHMKDYGTIDSQGLGKVVLSIFLIGVAIFVGRIVWRVTILRAGFLVEADLRKEMFLHAEKLSIRYYQEKKVGALMAGINPAIRVTITLMISITGATHHLKLSIFTGVELNIVVVYWAIIDFTTPLTGLFNKAAPIIPIIPEQIPIALDSNKNIIVISFFLAPKLRNKPISFLRSITEI